MVKSRHIPCLSWVGQTDQIKSLLTEVKQIKQINEESYNAGRENRSRKHHVRISEKIHWLCKSHLYYFLGPLLSLFLKLFYSIPSLPSIGHPPHHPVSQTQLLSDRAVTLILHSGLEGVKTPKKSPELALSA